MSNAKSAGVVEDVVFLFLSRGSADFKTARNSIDNGPTSTSAGIKYTNFFPRIDWPQCVESYG